LDTSRFMQRNEPWRDDRFIVAFVRGALEFVMRAR
jgi:hypothetical protein